MLFSGVPAGPARPGEPRGWSQEQAGDGREDVAQLGRPAGVGGQVALTSSRSDVCFDIFAGRALVRKCTRLMTRMSGLDLRLAWGETSLKSLGHASVRARPVAGCCPSTPSLDTRVLDKPSLPFSDGRPVSSSAAATPALDPATVAVRPDQLVVLDPAHPSPSCCCRRSLAALGRQSSSTKGRQVHLGRQDHLVLGLHHLSTAQEGASGSLRRAWWARADLAALADV